MTLDNARTYWCLSWWQAFCLFFFGLAGCIGAPFETGSEFEGLSTAPDASDAQATSSSSSSSTPSSSSTSTDPPSTTSTSSSSASTSTTVTTIIVSTVTPTPTCGVKYAQCGGSGWSGSTCCAPGLTCVVGSYYFSQCQ